METVIGLALAGLALSPWLQLSRATLTVLVALVVGGLLANPETLVRVFNVAAPLSVMCMLLAGIYAVYGAFQNRSRSKK
jgi:hypothetical protein